MPPEEWPICPKKGFKVNPEKRCPRCKKKKHLRFDQIESVWKCRFEGGDSRERKHTEGVKGTKHSKSEEEKDL